MIKNYEFSYEMDEATACFEVDTDKFTKEHANDTLGFFTWDYDEEADPIDEVMKKYALEAIRVATFNNYNDYGVIGEFDSKEGYYKVDGSLGIKLTSVSGYEFEDSKIAMSIASN